MIIELFGLPATGKTSIAKSLESHGCSMVRIGSRAELIWFNIRFALRFPLRTSALFGAIIANAGSLTLGYYKLMNLFLEHNARHEKARHQKRALLDQGHFQNLLSLFESLPDEAVVRRYLALLPKPDALIVLETAKEERVRRMEERGYMPRQEFGAAYAERFSELVERLFPLVMTAIENEGTRLIKARGDYDAVSEIVTELEKPRLTYATALRMPTEKGYGLSIAHMCHEFSRIGYAVELATPRPTGITAGDVFSYYDLPRSTSVLFIDRFSLFSILPQPLKRFAFYIDRLMFSSTLAKERPDPSVLYTRDPELVHRYPESVYTVVEVHQIPNRHEKLFASMLKKANVVIANSQGTASALEKLGIGSTPVHNAVDLTHFDATSEKIEQTRVSLKIPEGHINAMYTGHLYQWKGTDVLLEAARIAAHRPISFTLVGGTDADIRRVRQRIDAASLRNIRAIGHVRQSELPQYLMAADVLLLPNAPTTRESREYTAPIKLYYYIAAKRPIIASDLPSIRDVVGEDIVYFVPAGDAGALVSAIERVDVSSEDVLRRVERGFTVAVRSTWKDRARVIDSLITSL